MAIKNHDRRLALRFCLYIQALGAVPVSYQGQALRAYLIELEQQYQKLQKVLGPEVARDARVAGRTAIRERGYAEIAAMFPISIPPIPKKHRNDSPQPKIQSHNPPVQTSREDSNASSKRELYNCRRKIRHPHFLSALLHARRLRDGGLRIYPCSVCGGLHVGHAPEIAKQRRRILRALESIQLKLEEIDRDRQLLATQDCELRSELAAISQEHDLADVASLETEEADNKYERRSGPRPASADTSPR